MKLEAAKFILEAIEGNQDAEIREGYSGRGMYGKETCGIVLEDPNITGDIFEYIRDQVCDVDDWELIPDIPNFQLDSMGLKYIIY